MMKWLYKFTGTEDFDSFWTHIHSHDAHPFIQFIKYGIAGAIATAIYVGTFTLLNETIFPAHQGLDKVTRVLNFLPSVTIAFLLANVAGYIVNVKWVFISGRHSRRKELSFFLIASFVAFLLGTPLAQLLVWFGVNEYISIGITIPVSIMVNYTARKFYIFKG